MGQGNINRSKKSLQFFLLLTDFLDYRSNRNTSGGSAGKSAPFHGLEKFPEKKKKVEYGSRTAIA